MNNQSPEANGVSKPQLYWQRLDSPSPIQQLRLNEKLTVELSQTLGRQPTPEEHHKAFQEGLKNLTREVTQADIKEAVAEAKATIEILQAYVDEHGGNDE